MTAYRGVWHLLTPLAECRLLQRIRGVCSTLHSALSLRNLQDSKCCVLVVPSAQHARRVLANRERVYQCHAALVRSPSISRPLSGCNCRPVTRAIASTLPSHVLPHIFMLTATKRYSGAISHVKARFSPRTCQRSGMRMSSRRYSLPVRGRNLVHPHRVPRQKHHPASTLLPWRGFSSGSQPASPRTKTVAQIRPNSSTLRLPRHRRHALGLS
jgi:hypothetical protein